MTICNLLQHLGGFGDPARYGFDPDNVIISGNGSATFRITCDKPPTAEYGGGDSCFPEVALSLERLATYISPVCL